MLEYLELDILSNILKAIHIGMCSTAVYVDEKLIQTEALLLAMHEIFTDSLCYKYS